MDNHNKENSRKDNDIDLGSLLAIMGRGFAGLGRSIRTGAGGLGTALVNILVFLKRKMIWLLLAVVTGLAWGIYSGAGTDAKYSSEMTARFNFKSTLTLYNTIDYLNALIVTNKVQDLARVLSLTEEEAKDMVNFSAEPIIDELTISELYKQSFLLFDRSYRLRTDTFWTRIIPYEKFKESLTKFDIPMQRVKAVSTNASAFRKIEAGFLKLITENENLKNNYAINATMQREEENILLTSIRGLDTLRTVYNEKLRASGLATTSGGTTNVNLIDRPANSPELEIYNFVLSLKDELRSMRNYEMNNGQLVLVYASFNPVGKKVIGFQQNLLYTTLSAFIIALVILVAIEGLKIINAYEKRIKSRTSAK
jgi:hypothetical protein